MPYVNGTHLEPGECIDKGLCPECGRDLKQSSFDVERLLHWNRPEDPDVDQSERRYRIALLKHYFDPTAPIPERPLILTDAEKAAIQAARARTA